MNPIEVACFAKLCDNHGVLYSIIIVATSFGLPIISKAT